MHNNQLLQRQNDIYNYQGKDIKIGLIVSNLGRTERKERLTTSEIELLDSMCMDWTNHREWERLEPLIAYYNEFGTLFNIGIRDIYNYKGRDFRIGNLISRLRVEYKTGILSKDKVDLLNNMGMLWDATYRIGYKNMEKSI